MRRDQIDGLGLELIVDPGQIRLDLRQLVANSLIGIPLEPGLFAEVFQLHDLEVALGGAQGHAILLQAGIGAIEPAVESGRAQQHQTSQQDQHPLPLAQHGDTLAPCLPLCFQVHQGFSRAMPLNWKVRRPSLSRPRVSSPNSLPTRLGVCLKRLTQAGTS